MITLLLIVLVVVLLVGGVRFPDGRNALWAIVAILLVLWLLGVLR